MHDPRSLPEARAGRTWTGVSGLLVGGGAAAALLAPDPAAGALLLLGGVVLRMTLGRFERVLAGCGRFPGAALLGAGLVALAIGPGAWDARAFFAGLSLLGASLALGAAPPRDEPAQEPAAAEAQASETPLRRARGSHP